MQGYVVGFSGSKIFCLQNFTMQAVDVPQSAPMNQYIEKKMFHTAYEVMFWTLKTLGNFGEFCYPLQIFWLKFYAYTFNTLRNKPVV